MRELGRLAELESLWVKNFKSLKELVLDMPTRLTVVVGANGSGKTALVEVFELLTYILDWERGVISNPFAKFWGYDKVVWKHDEDLPVTIGFKLRLDGIRKRVQEIESENLRDTIMDVVKSIQLWLSKPVELKMEIAYELSITGRGGDFRILREDLLINSKDLKVSIDATKNLLTIVVDITEDLNFFVEKVKEVTKEIFFGVKEGEKLLLERLRSSRSTTELLSFYVPLLSKLGYSSKIRSYVVEVLSGLKRSQLSLILLLTLYSPELLTVPSVPSLELHAEMEEKCSVLKISATIGEDIEAGVVNPQDNIIDFFARNIMRGQSLLRLVRSVSEKLLFNTNSPKYQEILKRFKVLKERDIEKSLNVVKEIISYFIVDNLLHRA